MDATLLILATLAVWRVTHLLHAEAGPGRVVAQWRAWAGSGLLGQTAGCFHCLSLWVSVPAALWLGSHGAEIALLWLGLSAGAILLERLTHRTEATAEPVYVEDALDSDYPTIQVMDAAASPLAPSTR